MWPHLTPLCHMTQKLTHIQLTDIKKHMHIHKLVWLDNIFIRPLLTSISQLNFLGIKQNWPTSLNAYTNKLQMYHITSLNLHHFKKTYILLLTSLYFQVKDPQSFDEWLDQIDKVASLTNDDPYKLALAKSQSLFSKTISSYPPTLEWNKIKEHLWYNFGSVATKQYAASMLIDQQQKPSETLQEYVQTFSDLLLKSRRLLPHQAKNFTHIMHFY